jgi:hypothetical protein
MGMEVDRMKTNEEYRLLEQQLAERDAQLLKNADLLGEAADALDHKDKQIVMLRNTLNIAMWFVPDNPHIQENKRRLEIINEALAATSDLKDCILCDAEPVAYRYELKAGEYAFAENLYPNERYAARKIPLYKADIKDRFELVTVYSPKEKP